MKLRLAAATVVALVVAVTVVATGYGRKTAGTITIGAICDLSGPTSDIGVAYCKGETSYIDYINSKGGLKGNKIDMTAQDFAYNPAKAQTLYAQISGGKAVAVMGWGTADTTALVPNVTRDKLPFMSASWSEGLTNPDAAPYNFVFGTNYTAQAQIAAKYIAKDKKHHEIAFFHSNSAFGTSPIAGLKAYIQAKRLDIGFNAYPMVSGTTAFDAQLLQAQNQKADYIFLQNVPTAPSILAKDVKRLGLKAKLVCLNYCANEVFQKLAGAAGEGVIGVQPITPVAYKVPGDAVPEAYLKAHGSSLAKESNQFLSGWYTMAAMLKGIEKVITDKKELTGPNIKLALETMPAFLTGKVTDPVKFSTTSHDGMKGSRIYVIKGGKWTKLTGFMKP